MTRSIGEPAPDVLDQHLANITKEAGLKMMSGVFDVLIDRETIPAATLLRLTSDDVLELYEAWIGPAIDDVERSLAHLRRQGS